MDDIVKMEFKSFHAYIKTGYQYPKDVAPGTPDKEGGIDYTLPLKDIGAKLATLVHINPARKSIRYTTPLIHFASNLKTPGEYTFTLEVKIKGEVFESTFTQTFE